MPDERAVPSMIFMAAPMSRPLTSCIFPLAMFTPYEPSAGPTGGAGVACPAGHCSLILPVISLAMCVQREWFLTWRSPSASDRFDFPVFEFDGCRTAEDRHDDLHRPLLGVD